MSSNVEAVFKTHKYTFHHFMEEWCSLVKVHPIHLIPRRLKPPVSLTRHPHDTAKILQRQHASLPIHAKGIPMTLSWHPHVTRNEKSTSRRQAASAMKPLVLPRDPE